MKRSTRINLFVAIVPCALVCAFSVQSPDYLCRAEPGNLSSPPGANRTSRRTDHKCCSA